MSRVLEMQGLCKRYPSFTLDNLSFSLGEGKIMGFIGRNGAGKTTTIKSMLNLVRPDAGEITYWGMDFAKNEAEIKGAVGYAGSGVTYYPRKKIREIAGITRLFYPGWDNAQYRRYMQDFGIDEEKKPIELSEGMKIKLQLALALSHHARLLILDEPTSGLDPVSRDELLEIFLRLTDRGVSIFFSTHITSDLDKCADFITYIQKGRLIASCARRDFIDSYRLVTFDNVDERQKAAFLGTTRTVEKRQALIRREDAPLFPENAIITPDLEAIMVHLEKEERI